MKTAILFMGQLRTHENIINNFLNYLINDNTDVFFHFWKYEKDKNYLNENTENIKKICEKYNENSNFEEQDNKPSGIINGIAYPNNNYEMFIDKLKPKKYMIQEQIIFEPNPGKNIEEKILYQRRISPIYSIIMCLELIESYMKENNINYKNIFIVRPNTNFIKAINLSEYNINNQIFARGFNDYIMDYNILSDLHTLKKLYSFTFKNYDITNCECPEATLAKFSVQLGISIVNFDISNYVHGYRYGYIYVNQFKDYYDYVKKYGIKEREPFEEDFYSYFIKKLENS